MKNIVTLILIILFAHPIHAEITQDFKKEIESGKKALRKRDLQSAFCTFSELCNNKNISNEEAFEARLHLGITYSMASEYGKAMEQCALASELYAKENLGWEKELYLMNTIASVYYSEKKYTKARDVLLKCLSRSIEEKDSTQAVAYALNLASVANKLNNIDEASEYLKRAHDYYPGCEDKIRTKFHTLKAEILFNTKNYNDFFKESSAIIADTTFLKSERLQIILYHIKALRSIGRDEEALAMALDEARNATVEQKPEFYEEIADIYRKNGLYSKTVQFLDSAADAKERKNEAQNQKLIEDNRLKMQMLEAESGMNKKIGEAKHLRDVSILLAIIAIVALIAGAIAIAGFINRSRQQKKFLELEIEKEQQEKKLVETQMRETELYAKYRQSQYEKELQKQSHELASTTMFIASRNKLISELLETFRKINGIEKDATAKGLVKHLSALLAQGENRDKFITDFQKAHPVLLKRLSARHPNLSESDLQFLAYISMNLSNHDIASIMNISPDSAKKRRTRIGKKLGLTSSAELYKYLTALEAENDSKKGKSL